MRIAYVFDQVLPSTSTDTEQVINTVSALSRAGADVTLFLPRPLHTDPPSHRLSALHRYYQTHGDFAVEQLRSANPSLRPVEKAAHGVRAALSRRVRAHDVLYTRNIPAFLAGCAAQMPTVYETYRPWADQHRWLRPVFQTAMTSPAFVGGIFHSHFALEAYRRLGVSAERLEVVHNGFDPARFDDPPTREAARRELDLPTDQPICTYTGRVTLRKGLGIVLDMADALPDVTFVIVGSEDPRGEVEMRAVTQDNVIVRPWLTADELPPYLFASDILLIPPSLGPLRSVGNTVLPMKLFLYLAAARPIVAPAAPDTAELLTDGVNSILVPADDLDAGVAAIRRVVSDPALATEVATAARTLADGLTWDARARRILDYLDRRLAERERH